MQECVARQSQSVEYRVTRDHVLLTENSTHGVLQCQVQETRAVHPNGQAHSIETQDQGEEEGAELPSDSTPKSEAHTHVSNTRVLRSIHTTTIPLAFR